MQIYVRIAQVISILMKLIHQMEKDIVLNENITSVSYTHLTLPTIYSV